MESKDALRVTKGKGKWLKLEIQSHLQLKPSDMEVFLLDVSGGTPPKLEHTPDEGITIVGNTCSTSMGIYTVDVELKLDRVCKKLQFWVIAKTAYGTAIGKSIEFSAHNNGKAK